MYKLFTALLFISAFNLSLAQNTGRWTVSGSVSYAQPIGALNSIFSGTEIYSFEVGQFTENNLLWELKLEAIKFNKPNTSKLNPLVSDLSLSLDIYGASAQATYYILDEDNWLMPYITGSLGVYRWFYTRGAHYGIGVGNSLDTTNYLDTFKLLDWSAGFSFGGGCEFRIVKDLSVYADVRYKIVVGEIWQTLSLDIDNVSSMQMTTFNFGVRYRL